MKNDFAKKSEKFSIENMEERRNKINNKLNNITKNSISINNPSETQSSS
jgi:hypothetical protein